MDRTTGPIAAYRRYWLPELIALTALSGAAVVLFAATSLDIETMRPFYCSGCGDPWPVKEQPLWQLFYRSAPWVTASLAAAGSTLLIIGLVREGTRRFRWYGVFILLSVALGPGLMINAVLKDHWGRPRPRQVAEFGGRHTYVQPFVPAPSTTPRKSFPCGHCSVGYLYAAGWWIWRRSRPSWAAASLAAGLTVGTLLGIGRMAAGAHFLSDAVWSALIAYGAAHGLYYYVLRIPAREDGRSSLYPRIAHSRRLKAAAIAAAAALGLGIIGGGMLASPHDRDLAATISLKDLPVPPETVEVVADTLDVELHLIEGPEGTVSIDGFLHGFGLPTNVIRTGWEFETRPAPLLRFRVILQGWFTDIDGAARVRIPVGALRGVTVRVAQGDISVFDETRGAAAARLPELDLQTRVGRVLLPEQRQKGPQGSGQ